MSKRKYIDHSDHAHPKTDAARRACREAFNNPMPVERVVRKAQADLEQVADEAAGIDLSLLQGLVESLESASENLSGYASFDSGVVYLTIEGVKVQATWIANRWSVRLG